MSFSRRVLLLVVIAALVPLSIAFTVNVLSSISALRLEHEQKLIAIRDIKKAQLEMEFTAVKNNLNAISNLITADFEKLDSENMHQLLTKLNRDLHFYDIFVISPTGEVVYSVAREADYKTNLNTGPYQQSGLGKLYESLKSGSQSFEAMDFAPYAPSNDIPAAFVGISQQINNQVWVIAAQFSIDNINTLMQMRAGMGNTGETYLVGADNRMRSDSFLDPIGHSIQASFAGTIAQNGVDTAATKAGLQGHTAVETINDYNGNPVMSAYTPIDFFGSSWVLMAEIDKAEINQPIHQMMVKNLVVLALSIVIAVVIGGYVARLVMRPLGGEPAEMQAMMVQVAQGNLTLQLNEADPASLRGALNHVILNLRHMMVQMSVTSQQLSTTAEELSNVTSATDANMSQQATELDTIVTAVNEMAVTVNEVSARSSEVASEMNDAHQASQESMLELEHSEQLTQKLSQQIHASHLSVNALAENISGITALLEVIRGVADQTNLLALNAAIEAARAGESGRGFAVVADEVRNLARRTQESTQLIEKVIADVSAQSADAVHQFNTSLQGAAETKASIHLVATSIRQIVNAVNNVNQQILSVSAATEQQASVASAIDENLVSLRDLSQVSLRGSHETNISSRQVAEVAESLNGMIQKFQLS